MRRTGSWLLVSLAPVAMRPATSSWSPSAQHCAGADPLRRWMWSTTTGDDRMPADHVVKDVAAFARAVSAGLKHAAAGKVVTFRNRA